MHFKQPLLFFSLSGCHFTPIKRHFIANELMHVLLQATLTAMVMRAMGGIYESPKYCKCLVNYNI